MAQAPTTTPRTDLDAARERRGAGALSFARLGITERIALAESMRAGYARVAARGVRAACEAKGPEVGTAAEGEEWIAHPFITLLHLRLWVAALRSIEQSGTTPIGKVRRTIDNRPYVTLFPSNLLDATLFPRVHGEVHLQAGASPDERARFYRQPDHEGRVVLVLGRGNVNSLPPLDVATKMINEGKVCLLKMNPVNAYLGPLIEEAFAEPIRQKFLAIVYGGGEEGAYVASHPGVDEGVITGADRTPDLLVWGPPRPEREARGGGKH